VRKPPDLHVFGAASDLRNPRTDLLNRDLLSRLGQGELADGSKRQLGDRAERTK
jgi:hypothetical protein